MNQDRKFFFDKNIFDAPPKNEEEVVEDLPPPPPTFSEEELSAAKDIAFEQGRQLGQKEQIESREQFVAQSLEKIAENFSRLFAAETMRENIFEKEALRLGVMIVDLLFPSLNERVGHGEALKAIEKTLAEHRKTKEIKICVPAGLKGEVETLISRLRASEHEEVLWRVIEDPALSPGDCTMEWGDGGAVRDSVRTARDIRSHLEALLGGPLPQTAEFGNSEADQSVVLSESAGESASVEGEEP
ncbi:MAG: flagellar protein FlbE [Micavibrio aeruginosavorus]|uniref:Flagellar protein FlbE n=1 Tax=Micavibrio aeruginosavorus TaxID=349221 RepID=A0A2W5PIY4_9BACT|nr:MAG: flagellar protein FlbE [Micavibrio aeruginosavorus]